MLRILTIETDKNAYDAYEKALVPPHSMDFWPNGEDIAEVVGLHEFDLIIMGFKKASDEAFDLLRKIRMLTPQTPVLASGDTKEPSLIVRAIREGAFDFVPKPFVREKMVVAVDPALENRHLRDEIDYLRREQDVLYDFDRIIAVSPAMKRLIATLKRFAETDSTILITGETGTGKSFLSGAVHFNSKRRAQPFIKINCANIPETLLESELFGHEKGAFTGAAKTRVGRLEQGRGGTVFLDEIGEMTLALQAKLLRFLEEKSFERVGGNKTIHSDVRLIAATNRHPEEQVAEGRFREDLYYRLNVLRVHLPPLRERQACIPHMACYLLTKSCRSLKKNVRDFTPEVTDALMNYAWPGNIRQLANTIERAVILEDGNTVHMESVYLPEAINRPQERDGTQRRNPESNADSRAKQTILEALEECLWVQKDAALALGVSPRALNYQIKKFNITHPRWRKHK